MNNQGKMFPYVEIIEQPAKKRYRFLCENDERITRFMSGENSEPDNKTYPTIRIVGYEGQAVVVVSCVTSNEPYRPHPHRVIGRKHNNQGVITFKIHNDQSPIVFSELKILYTKEEDIIESLQLREKIRVDPFKTGFDFNINEIDLSVIRLCFQVFLQEQNGKFQIPLEPVVSKPIYDKKAATTTSDLVICSLSHVSAPTSGGMEMILLCNKVVKEDIQIVFYEQVEDQVIWQDFGEFEPANVHKHLAISFKTPKYTLEITRPVRVNIMLRKPSDGTKSEPWPFTLIPMEKDNTKIPPSPSTNLNFKINSIHALEELTKDLEGLTDIFPTSLLLTEESAEIKEDTDGKV